MHLIQLLLPLYDNDGKPFGPALFRQVQAQLTEKFGGLTAYSRAPAEGLWRESGTKTVRDDIVIFEVMTESLDRDWWRTYRARLQRAFAQEKLVIRATEVEAL